MCTMGAKIIDDLGARKMGCCLKAVFDGRIRMKVIGSLTRLKCVMKIGFGSTTPKLSCNLHNGPVISQALTIFSCILQDDNFYKLYVSPLKFSCISFR